MRQAARIDENQPEIVKALRSVGCLVQSMAAMGKGFPDLLVYRPSTDRYRLLEVKDGAKSPSRQALTPDQEKFHAIWPVTVVNSVEAALAAMGFNPDGSNLR